MDENIKENTWGRLFEEAASDIGGKDAHWFSYHFRMRPPHPFARSILDACTDCEHRLPGLGFRFVQDIASICGKERVEPHYDQLMQKLAEILVLRQLLILDWPAGTTFQHEPAASAGGKRPELRVVTPDTRFLFEVKAPSLLDHIRKREANDFQVAGRTLPIAQMVKLAGDGGLTLPRDNPIKDFLLDADKKFVEFKAIQNETSILIVVWDDYVYEPITVLMHEDCGLLTANSYLKDEAGEAVQFASIDAVIVVRHLTYFYRASRDEPLEERGHALDFGGEHALPNVFFPLRDPGLLPDFVRLGLRALAWNDPWIQSAADYRPNDMIMWL